MLTVILIFLILILLAVATVFAFVKKRKLCGGLLSLSFVAYAIGAYRHFFYWRMQFLHDIEVRHWVTWVYDLGDSAIIFPNLTMSKGEMLCFAVVLIVLITVFIMALRKKEKILSLFIGSALVLYLIINYDKPFMVFEILTNDIYRAIVIYSKWWLIDLLW